MRLMLFEGLDLHEIYSLITGYLLFIFIFLVVLFFVFRVGLHIKFLEGLAIFFHKHKKRTKRVLLFLILLVLVGFVGMKYISYDLDSSTAISPPEKFMVIEIDDYWNINDSQIYFENQGYSMENYRSVSDIIDKYGFTATLGASPHIFIEDLRQTFDLADDPVMINYLLELQEKGYEVAMHGYSHCRNEYYCPKYEEVWFNVRQGRKEIEDLMGESPFTYLPPGNSWTTEQYENVKKAGFLMIANTHVPKLYYDEEVIITPRGYDPVYHWGWYSGDFRHAPYSEWIEVLEQEDFFILQLHCNTFDSQEKLDDLDNFLSYVKEMDIPVLTYREAYSFLSKD